MLYVFHCLQTFLLFSERLNWKNNNSSSLQTFSFKMSHDLATKLIVGKIMFRFNDQCRFYILGQGSTYLFIYYSYVYLYSKYVAANAFGIRKYLRILGRVSPTEWHTYYTHYIDINLSPSRCSAPWHCLFQAIAGIDHWFSHTPKCLT